MIEGFDSNDFKARICSIFSISFKWDFYLEQDCTIVSRRACMTLMRKCEMFESA